MFAMARVTDRSVRQLMRVYRGLKRYLYLRMKYKMMDLFSQSNGVPASPPKNPEYIGSIDQDGLIHCADSYRDLFDSPNLYKGGDYLDRKKFSIHIVRADNRLLIEKNYNGNIFSFYNELSILGKLSDLDYIPCVLAVSFEEKILYLEYVHGAVLREKLAALGAGIRDIDLAGEKRSFEQKAAGARPYLNDVLTESTINRIRQCYENIHARKIMVHDIKYGNIILNEKGPCLIDFETSICFPELPGFMFKKLAETDNQKINTLFGAGR